MFQYDSGLPKTAAVVARHVGMGNLDTYAVFARIGERRSALFSPGVDPDTLFDMASCGKILVTTPLVLQAIDRKLIRLDQTLPDFFGGVPDDIRGVTVKHLLTHTSGIVRNQFYEPEGEDRREGFIRQIFATTRAFAPGTAYTYSCHGMILLGFILEKVYGKPLEEIFNENLRDPLGYTRSRFNVDFGEANTAVSYHWEGPESYPFPRPWDDENVRVLGTTAGSGGQFFSLADIDRYLTALLEKDPRLYGETVFDLAERDYTPTFTVGRGLGYHISDARFPDATSLFPSGTTFGHIGATGTAIFLNRASNGAVVILTNLRRSIQKNGMSYPDYHARFDAFRYEIYDAIKADFGF